MLKRRSWQVAWYLACHRMRFQLKNGFSRLVFLCSVAGIALGVAGFILLDTFMKFREQDLLHRSLIYLPHAVVTFRQGVDEHRQLIEVQSALSKSGLSMLQPAPLLLEEALFQTSRGLATVQLMGVENWDAEPITSAVIGDAFPPKPNAWKIWIGIGLARKLGVFPGDRIRLIVPSAHRITPVGPVMVSRIVQIAALFQTHSEADANQILLPIAAAKRLLKPAASSGGSYRLTFDNPLGLLGIKNFPEARWEIERWQDWRAQKGFLAKAIQLERTALMMLVWLVTLVASGHLAISLGLRMSERTAEIAILQTQGLTKFGVLLSFWMESVLTMLVGLVFGSILGFIGRSYFPELAKLYSICSVCQLHGISRQDLFGLGVRFIQILGVGGLITLIISGYAGAQPPAKVLYRE